MSLPGASELFRGSRDDGADPREPAAPDVDAAEDADEVSPDGRRGQGTGRVRHDEKITVYVSGDELLALEQARLTLRARYKVAVDRGRIVREAVAAALADLEAQGPDSELVRRLDRR